MKIPRALLLLAPFCLLTTFVIASGIFDHVYSPNQAKNLEDQDGSLWTYFLLFFIGACFYRVVDAWRLARERKVTQMDIYFLSVMNGFALIQLIAYYFLHSAYFHPKTNDVMIRRVTALVDWSTLPFFGWTIAWSRHVRRGWTPQLNWMVCMVSSLSFFLVLVHRSSFYFILSVAMVLSCIAIYETYKVHFYRQEVKPLFFTLLSLHIVFYITRSLEFFVFDSAWLWTYFYVVSFTLITSLTNRLYLTILIEVNEHKL